jgi:ABC-type multidrug transport system fused ATPase/permease subunit
MRELYRPKTIRLSLDNRMLAEGFAEISEDVSLIPQEPELFNTTIFENITMGTDVALDKVVKYTDMACFTDIAQRLPNKFESSISEKGVNLSGGEKQRLALARGLLASEGKSIILLDEPTSSVDVVNELKILQNILREFHNKTIISSVHRLHLLVFFNKIVYFRAGRIVAQGTLPEVLENRQFRKVWDNYNRSKKLEMLRVH